MTRPAARPSSAAAAAHQALVRAVGLAIRRMGAQSVVTSQIIAARFGIHTTDLEVLDHVYLGRNSTPGELARATGLTPGSMTTLLDRLAAAGYVERRADVEDRRRVRVRVRPVAIAPIKETYAPMQSRMFALWSTYPDRDLRVIEDFLRRSTDLAVACAEEIQRAPRRRRSRRTTRRRRGATPAAARPEVARQAT
jgi:DNA-binding MarR family transcriptional regulator